MFRSIFLFFPPSVFSHSYTESCWHTGYTYFLRLTTAVLPLLLCSSTYCLSLGRKPRARAASKQASKTGHWSLIFSSAGRVVSLSSHNGENSSYHHGSSRWAAQRYQVLFTSTTTYEYSLDSSSTSAYTCLGLSRLLSAW